MGIFRGVDKLQLINILRDILTSSGEQLIIVADIMCISRYWAQLLILFCIIGVYWFFLSSHDAIKLTTEKDMDPPSGEGCVEKL